MPYYFLNWQFNRSYAPCLESSCVEFTSLCSLHELGMSLFGITWILWKHLKSNSFATSKSSQSRADLLALGLAVTNVLTGLVWLSIRPKSISVISFS